jgi:pimeloyl-ACP methyl ester carboxylesterase
MDGTGEMLAEFAREAQAHFDAVQVIAYPRDKAMDYAALAPFVRASLPKDAPFVLLGESFSGPLALQIASSAPRGLQGVVLSTSFARDPVPMLRPFATLLARLPVRAVPMRVVAWWLLGRWQTPALRAALRHALGSLAPDVLPARMRCAMQANQEVSAIQVPLLYLRATEDRLIEPKAGDWILSQAQRGERVVIEGPHLLLQAAPRACASAIGARFNR